MGFTKFKRFKYRCRYRRMYRRRKNYLLSYLFKSYLFIFFIALILVLIILLIPPKPKKPQPLDVSKMKRSTAYKRGMDMINYVWEYNHIKNSIVNNEEITMPRYLKKDGLVSGIPYCWGGYIALDISNQPQVKNFQDAIIKGYIAGNINTSEGYKPLTAGLDCSGFVSAVFKLPVKASTETLEDYFYPIKLEDLKPMDILNSKKNHVFIFLKESADKKGMIVMEATTGKNITFDRTIINYRSYEDIKKDVESGVYVPMRFKKIVDDDVKLFRDKYEFNNFDYLATKIDLGESYEGYLDFAGDIDNYKINLTKGTYKLNFTSKDNTKIEINDGNIKVLETSKSGEYVFDIINGENVKISIFSDELKYDVIYKFKIEN